MFKNNALFNLSEILRGNNEIIDGWAEAGRELQPPRSFGPAAHLQTNTNISMSYGRSAYLIDQRCEPWLSPCLMVHPSRRSPVDLPGLLRSLTGRASRLSPLVVRIFERSSKTKRFRRQQKAEASLLQ